MHRRQRESGSSFRKKRAKRDKEDANLSGSLRGFLNVDPKSSSSTNKNDTESMEVESTATESMETNVNASSGDKFESSD